jgi:hypothetical protein
MSNSQITQKFVLTVDGKDHIFDSRKEADDFIRKPKVKAALLQLTENNEGVTDWLMAHQEQVEVAFEAGSIKRVTKSEHNKLKKALEEIVDKLPKNFVSENFAAVLDSFRWPSVKRMNTEEKTLAARNTLLNASEGNEELANWILANQEAVLEAYKAGIEKREVNPKASEALAAYRAKKAAEKAAAAAAA